MNIYIYIYTAKYKQVYIYIYIMKVLKRTYVLMQNLNLAQFKAYASRIEN